MTETIRKIWGYTDPLIITPMFEMHRLVIDPYCRCSTHVHKCKHNAFYVLDGLLYIDVCSSESWFTAAELMVGGVFTVRPGDVHRFRTGSRSCIVLEMYYTEPLSEDIVRYEEGRALDALRSS